MGWASDLRSPHLDHSSARAAVLRFSRRSTSFNIPQGFTRLGPCGSAVGRSFLCCSSYPPRSRCDLRDPEVFKDMQVPDPGSKNYQSHQWKVKDYVPNENDKKLQEWLNDWRRRTNKEVHGEAWVEHCGPSNIMLDETFERICDAAHHNLIASADDLYKKLGCILASCENPQAAQVLELRSSRSYQ